MTTLTRKGVKFVWSEACENSFRVLKDRLVSALILSIPDGMEDFVIFSDGSLSGLC